MRSSIAPPPLPRHVQQGSVAQTVRALPVGASPSEVWRGAALSLLRLNAEEVKLLAAVFEEEATRDDTRLLVLDLLSGAGTFEVQSTMRRLLSLALARRSNRTFAAFVQRLGFLDEPDGPTLRYLMSVYAEARGEPEDVRAACAYALGACAGHAFRAGDEDAAVRATEMVRRDLFLVSTTAEKRALLLALGNAGLTTDLPAIIRAANDPDSPVRAAAAIALRKIDDREARSQLVSMIGDPDVRVGESAIVALSEHRLGEPEVEEISEAVQAGRTAMALDGRLLRLLVAQRKVIAARAGRPSPLENALRLLLGRVEAAVEASTNEKRFGDRAQWSWVTPTGPSMPGALGDSGSMPVMRSPSVPVMRASGFVPRADLGIVPQTNPAAPDTPAGHPFSVEPDSEQDFHAFPPSSIGARTQCEDMRETMRGVEAEAAAAVATLETAPTVHEASIATSVPIPPSVKLAPDSGTMVMEEPPLSDAPTMIRAEGDGHSSEGSLVPPVDTSLAPGVYRLVPSEGGMRVAEQLTGTAHVSAVEAMRKRMLELGLDPDARSSMLPLPPPKSANGR